MHDKPVELWPLVVYYCIKYCA